MLRLGTEFPKINVNFLLNAGGLELGNNAVMALHDVTDPQNWGCVWNNTLYEKPSFFSEGNHWAWGLMGFKDTYGQELFSNVTSLILKNVGFTFLDKFEDITRDK